MSEKKKSLDDIIAEELESAPTIRGYTIKKLAEKVNGTYPTTRWTLERMEAKGIIEHFELGRAKIYQLKKIKSQREETKQEKEVKPR